MGCATSLVNRSAPYARNDSLKLGEDYPAERADSVKSIVSMPSTSTFSMFDTMVRRLHALQNLIHQRSIVEGLPQPIDIRLTPC